MSTLPVIKGTVVVKLKGANQPVPVTIQLIRKDEADSTGRGKFGSKGEFEGFPSPGDNNQYTFPINFDYDDKFGIPGAFYIKYHWTTEFFLVSLTLEDIPNVGNIFFDCNSWIYNENAYKSDRIFFTNQTYLPNETPLPLVYYREAELQTLRGDGTGERKGWERIYDYDVYNDLGDEDKDESLARPVAGGSPYFPYPRRGRTGRKPTNTNPNNESRSNYVYIPRDEQAVILTFGRSPPQLKIAQEAFSTNSTTKDEFEDRSLLYKLESIAQEVVPKIQSVLFNTNSTTATAAAANEFISFEDVIINLYKEVPTLSVPQVIQVNQSAWKTDEEFTREIIAGVNPNVIRAVSDLPPNIKLHGEFKGIQGTRLFLLDHYETILPYLSKINSTPLSRTYASKTYLSLTNDGTLKPEFIELSLPNPEGDQFDVVTKTYFPAPEGTAEGSLWQLAKVYVIVNDACFHQLISHWLHTHAVVEPFVIATNRQLSVVHPIYKLLQPHFRNTMNINAAARKSLINAGGIIENTYSWGKYAVEMSSVLYKDWVFPEQALPVDLIKRGMAVKDPKSPHGLRLVIEDYPYAVDGLEIWEAIQTWVQEYVFLYYTSDASVKQDRELQSWWKEVVEVGHGDKKDETWWPKMHTREELIQSSVTLIWITSALHAAVNFGQYPYGGLILNRPTLSRRFIPEEDTAEYDELVNFPEQAYLKTIIPKPLSIINLSTLEVLSTHSSDEFYLGQRESAETWTSDQRALEAFKRFGETLAGIEDNINQRNNDATLKNRVGPVVMPYTLLYPTSGPGITFRGVPNSISI